MMTVMSYARIENGTVAEVFITSQQISEIFCPELTWVPVPAGLDIVPGWTFNGTSFAAPPPRPEGVVLAPTLADLQAQLQALAAQINALKA